MPYLRTLILLALVLSIPSLAFADDVPDQSKAKVVKIESGEVIVVRLADSKKQIKVRVIGIDCDGSSRSAAAQLVGRQNIVLRSDKGFLPLLEDQFGRHVAYVTMKDGRDLGLELLKSGQCSTKQWNLPHPRVTEYASVH